MAGRFRFLPFLAVPLLLATFAAPADAATYTSNGVRCTKVGTGGNDVLVGTLGRDVLCGLGGNDRLVGGAGDDVLDGGLGADALDAGPGADVLMGGAGNDTLTAGAGNDQARGDAGNDTLVGGDGTDRVSGGDGTDKVSGDNGNDLVAGGTGDDTLNGGSGGDQVYGGDGNDDLDGGLDADGLHGEGGTNWCTLDPLDTTRAQCVYDQVPPTIDQITATPDYVDVTSKNVPLTLRAHVTDDTGAAYVQVRAATTTTGAALQISSLHLVSGTVRDGWWQASGAAARYGEPGRFSLNGFARDRLGRFSDTSLGSLTIDDATPDRDMPTVTELSLSSDTLDVRGASADITVTAHVTDALSGSDPGDVLLCLQPPSGDGGYRQLACDGMDLVWSPTVRNDGWWHATHRLPQGSVGGDWSASIWVTDAVHRAEHVYYVSPDVYRAASEQCPPPSCNSDPRMRQLPNGAGRFTVMGTAETAAAVAQGMQAEAPDVDTLGSAATVVVDVHASDAPGEGVTALHGYLRPSTGGMEGDPTFRPVDGVLVAGTVEDGTWRLTYQLPQGTPPDRYAVELIVEDRSHWRVYIAAASSNAGQPNQLVFPAEALTRRDAAGPAWDGVITVVPHS